MVSVGFQSARLARGKMAAADSAAAPESMLRRDSNFLVISTPCFWLPGA
jgi:hypothetical protein